MYGCLMIDPPWPKGKGGNRAVRPGQTRDHSRKPDLAYDMVSSLYPDLKKIDVFSREKRQGWDQFGNQTEYFS